MANPRHNPIRILHVDDDSLFLETSKLMLNDLEENLVINCALSVDEAFNKIAGANFDVVVSDFEMPLKNGLDFLEALKKQGFDLPFILFTGKGREEVAIEALNLGAIGYYNKAGSPETVFGELLHGIVGAYEKWVTEKQLEESEKKYSALMDQAVEAIYVHNSKGIMIDVNQRACKMLGYNKVELVSRSIVDIDPEATEEKKGALWHRVFEGETFTFESHHRRKDGSLFPVEVSLGAINIGKEPLVMGAARDITERKIAQEALLRAKRDWENTFNSISDFIALIDNNHRIIRVNRAMAEQLGCKPEEAVGLRCFECVHGTNVPPDFCPHSLTTLDGKEHVAEVTELRLGGDYVITTVPWKDETGLILGSIHIAKKVSEVKKLQNRVRESEDILKDIIETTSDKIFLLDTNYRYILANKSLSESLGKESEDIIGKSIAEIHEAPTSEMFYKNAKAVFNSGEKVTIEENVKLMGKDAVLSTVLSPVVDESGKITAVAGIVRDITQNKVAEMKLKRSAQNIRDVNRKLKVVGSLTRHDVANKLTAARANLYMLRKKTKDNEELTQYFDAIEAAFDKSSEIFEFSNIYEKVGSKKLEQINVGEVFDEAILLLPHRNVEVVNNVHDLNVLADGMLRQLFYNLIDNSMKYGKTVSKISLNYEEGGMLFELVYEDNGVGVPMENKLRIFDGYTTGGSGLGLKLIKRMIEVYGWHISEQGQPGYGARFVISIPKISS